VIEGSFIGVGKVVTDFYGMVGSVPLSATPADRRAFWAALDGRLSAIAAKFPGLLDAEEIVKIKDKIARHVPRPAGAEHRRRASVEQRVRRVSVEA